MHIVGIASLGLAFVAIVVSIASFVISRMVESSARTADKKSRESYLASAKKISLVGYTGVFVTAAALIFACALILYCFITGTYALEYVVRYHTEAAGELGLLFKISGLWGGREGSLLFWAALIGLFAAVVGIRSFKNRKSLDNMALVVILLVILAFVTVLLFSETNMPFVPLDPRYIDASGHLKTFNALILEVNAGATGLEPGLVTGMNSLLEHWAMAIHPPTLFIGYAGLTVPFGYAIAALIVNDPSKKWVEAAQRYAMFSWVFLGLGIGLGAVWAYVVLGWGGYWGWDPVENASLLSWIVTVALVHSFTVYRQRNAFKAWAVFCSCLAFTFVILGTFITRSGVVQNSVHAFDGDQVSLVLFLVMIIASLLAGVIGLIIRWKSFTADTEDTLGESMMSKGVMYFFNNVILVLSAVVIAYLTLSSALPSFLPLGGDSLPASTYNAIARPLTIVYAAIMAICPLVVWMRADWKGFRKRALIPGICGILAFAGLMAYFFLDLAPSYYASIAAGGSHAEDMLSTGPTVYYFALTILGFLVSSLLFFNSLFMIGRTISGYAKAKGINPVAAFFPAMWNRASAFGGFLAHLSIAIIIVGLIGSSMYVTQQNRYLSFDLDTMKATEELVIDDYRLVSTGSSIEMPTSDDKVDTMMFDVYKGNTFIGTMEPAKQETVSTQQSTARAAVITGPVEDLFVVYNGYIEDASTIWMTAYINPLVVWVWIGFGLLMVGTIIATVGRRAPKVKDKEDVDGALTDKRIDGDKTPLAPTQAPAEAPSDSQV